MYAEEPHIGTGNTSVKTGPLEVMMLSVVNKPKINIKQPLPNSVL